MKSLTLRILVFLFGGNLLFGQSTYYTQLTPGPNGTETNSVACLANGNILLSWTHPGSTSGLTMRDSLGNLLWTMPTGINMIVEELEATADGGFLAGGGTTLFNPGGEAFIFRADSMGNVAWYRTYSNSSVVEQIKECPDGTFYFRSGSLVARLNSGGTVRWAGYYPAAQFDVTSDTGFVALSSGLSGGDYRTRVSKFDSLGNFEWGKNYSGASGYSIDSKGIVGTKGGRIVFGGITEGLLIYVDHSLYLHCLDLDGQFIWGSQGTIGPGTTIYGGRSNFLATPDSGFIALGEKIRNIASNRIIEIWATKFDADGRAYYHSDFNQGAIGPRRESYSGIDYLKKGEGFTWCHDLLDENYISPSIPPQGYVGVISTQTGGCNAIGIGLGGICSILEYGHSPYTPVTTPLSLNSTLRAYSPTFSSVSPFQNPICHRCNQPSGPNFSWTTSQDTVFFTDESQFPLGWHWDFGDCSFDTAQNPVHVFDSSRAFMVCQTVYGLCDTSSRCYLVNLCPPAKILGPDIVCQGDSFTFYAGSGGNTWQWLVNGSAAGNADSIRSVIGAGGSFTLDLITGNGSCQDTVSRTIQVSSTPPVSGFSYSQTGLTATGTFTGSVANSIRWDWGDGASDTSANAVHTYATAGTYSICVIASNECGNDTSCQTFQCAPVQANFTYSVSGTNVTLTNTSTGATSFSWDFDDYLSSTDASPVHQFTQPGDYNICLTSSNGCTSSTICYPVAILPDAYRTQKISYSDSTGSKDLAASTNGRYYVMGDSLFSYHYNDGQMIWKRNFAQTGTFRLERIIPVNDGTPDCYIGGGVYNTTLNRYQPWIARIDSSGAFVWQTALSSTYEGWVEDMALSPSGNITAVGKMDSGILFARVSANGAVLLQKNSFVTPGPAQIVGTSWGDFYMALNNNLMRVDSIGNQIWSVMDNITVDRMGVVNGSQIAILHRQFFGNGFTFILYDSSGTPVAPGGMGIGGVAPNSSPGNINYLKGFDFVKDSNKNIWVAGTYGIPLFTPNMELIMLFKLDSLGRYVDDFTTGTNFLGRMSKIAITDNNNLVWVGKFQNRTILGSGFCYGGFNNFQNVGYFLSPYPATPPIYYPLSGSTSTSYSLVPDSIPRDSIWCTYDCISRAPDFTWCQNGDSVIFFPEYVRNGDRWTYGNGNFSYNLPTPQYYSTPGPHTVCVHQTQRYCLHPDTVCHDITLTPPCGPARISTSRDTLCEGDSLHLYNASSGTILSQTWLINGTNVGNTPTISLLPATNVLDVKLIVQFASCTDTACQIFYVNPVAYPNMEEIYRICPGETLILRTNSPFYVGSTQWSTGMNYSQEAYSTPGIHWVETTTPRGCISRDSFELQINPVPPPALGPDTLVCDSSCFTLMADSGYIAYLWDGVPGGPWLTQSDTGTFHLHFLDEFGCWNEDSIRVFGEVSPYLAQVLGPDTVICPPTTIQLNAGGGFTSYAWSNGSTNQTLSVTSPGIYAVTASNAGCTGSDSIVIGAAPPVPVSAGPDQTVCPGDTALLAGSTPAGQFLWSTGDTTMGTSTSLTGPVILTVTDSNGCQNSDTAQVLNFVLPPFNPTGPGEICPAQTAILDAGAGWNTYSWSTGNTSQTISVGTGTYFVSVTDGNGCEQSDTLLVALFPSPTLNLGSDTSICGAAFSQNLDAGPGFATYAWSNGWPGQIILASTAGTYWVNVVDSFGCAFTDSITLTSIPGPAAAFNFTNSGNTFSFSDASSGTPSTWLWDFGDGNNSSLQFPMHTYATSGNFTVCLTVTNVCGTDSSCQTILLVSGDSPEPGESWVQVFPNPTSGHIFLQWNFGTPDAQFMDVVNALGAHIERIQLPADRAGVLEWDGSHLANGIYYLQFHHGSEVHSLQMVKE